MGRTKRKRKRKTNLPHCETNPAIINLKKFMKSNSWINETELELKQFHSTGRGVASRRTINENTVLIRVPLSLLISFDTIIDSGLMDFLETKEPFKIQDLLSLFLVFEKHKDNSFWFDYIESLPKEDPLLPWLCSEENITKIPLDLKETALSLRVTFQESFERVSKSIRLEKLCSCCKKGLDCVLDVNLFRWAYVLVNTRAVYVDPQTLHRSDLFRLLSDRPSMGLCPYLDMFNHNYTAKTRARITSSYYELVTETKHQKHDQVFISYGNHDNVKLLMEYGFFIPSNPFDSIPFHFDKIKTILGFDLTPFQFRFIKEHNLTKDLYINSDSDLSFNLKSLLFVILNPNLKNYSFIFHQNEIDDVKSILKLLEYKKEQYVKDYERLVNVVDDNFNVLREYANYRIVFVQTILNKLN